MGKSLDSPAKGSVDKMSEKCRKNLENVEKLSGGAENTIFGHVLDNFLPIWWMLLFGDPVQCSPVTTQPWFPSELFDQNPLREKLLNSGLVDTNAL